MLISLTVYIPRRNGRHGHVYTNHGKMNLFNAKYETGCHDPLKKDVSVRPARALQQSLYPPSSESKGDAWACGFAYCTIFIFITIMMDRNPGRTWMPETLQNIRKCVWKALKRAESTVKEDDLVIFKG